MKHLNNKLITALLVGLFFQPLIAFAASPPRALIITGNGNAVEHDYPYPPWIHEFHSDKVAEILQGIVSVDISSDLAVLNDRDLQRYDLLINNSLFLTPTQDQLDALHRFIGNGKAYLTLHAGLISFINSEYYEDLIGGRYIGGPANEPEKFNVITQDEWWGYDYRYRKQAQHPVALVSGDFLAEDELYYVQPNTTDIEIIARAENHPVMWWKPWRKGKVMCLTLGHSLEAKNNPGYQALLRNGVRWLAGHPLIEKIPDAHFENDTQNIKYFDLSQVAHHENPAELRFSIIGNTNDNLVSAQISNHGGLNLNFSEGKTGSAIIHVQVKDDEGFTGSTKFLVSVFEKGSGNLARYYGVSAHSSSNEGRRVSGNPLNVVDADINTRWSSDFEDPSWIYVDLGEPYRINRVRLSWEGAFAKQYEIEVANNIGEWRSVYDEKNGDGETDEIQFEPVEARYVRMLGKERALSSWGYSLYEFEVYGVK